MEEGVVLNQWHERTQSRMLARLGASRLRRLSCPCGGEVERET
jgi:hypothetical protein